MLNPRLETLSDYPFQRLARLLSAIDPPPGRPPVDLSIGQPMHPIPPLMIAALRANEHLWGRYPPVTGSPAFRQAVAAWLTRRYRLPAGLLDPERHVLPVAGTKEALFLIAQTVTGEHKAGRRPAVLLPNPFYNVYLGGAVMAGAEPVLLAVTAETGYLPVLDELDLALLDRTTAFYLCSPANPQGVAADLGGAVIAGAEPVLLAVTAETGYLPVLDELDPALLDRTAAFYLCSPANPQGVAADLAYLKRLVGLARRHDFLLIMDECYAEIYTRDPPVGALEAAVALDGRLDSVIVCHSLSKRSSAAGLRSGFVAGDLDVLAGFAHLRSYGAAVQPLPVLAAATALWQDEEHVIANRALYREKFDLADARLGGRVGYYRPDGGFFLWLDVGDGEAAARRLWAEAAIKVLPGAYLGRPDGAGDNPGRSAIRVALVYDLATTEAALADLVAVLS